MSHYLLHGIYKGTAASAGLSKEGGTSRLAQIKALIESVGGKLVSDVYYGFGEQVDVYAICEFPDHASAAAVTIAACPGGVTIKTTVLMTPAEIDEAVKKSPSYRAPGT